MRYAGIDIGSRAIKLVLLEDGEILRIRIADTTFDPLAVCRDLLEGLDHDRIIATGYGRHLFAEHWKCEVVTEIKAVAMGARALLPSCRTIIDVGGQDTKAITITDQGKLHKFAMNDRCAAGTGRFLEVMADALSFSREEFAQKALSAVRAEKLSSMCTVFAESEVISLVARGSARQEIALGIHQAISTRILSLVKGIQVVDDVLFAGGGALNACLRRLIEAGLDRRLHLPDQPQIAAALGCALHGDLH